MFDKNGKKKSNRQKNFKIFNFNYLRKICYGKKYIKELH